MQNLARTAGFADPVRLTWAMEAHLTADLAGDGVTVEHEGVTAVPVGRRRRPPVGGRAARRQAAEGGAREAAQGAEVARAHRRARPSCAARRRGSASRSRARWCAATRSPAPSSRRSPSTSLLWPSISRLVLVGDGTAGFPDRGGRVLRAADGGEHAIGDGRAAADRTSASTCSRATGRHGSATSCRAQLVQPFKQVFRELYLPVDAERTDAGASRRYAGHQVQPAAPARC